MEREPHRRTPGNLGRRPIATRSNGVVRAVARRLAVWGVAPNIISLASLIGAGIAAAAFLGYGWAVVSGDFFVPVSV